MELATLDVDRDEARRLYLEYRNEKTTELDAELQAIAAGYRAISRGHQVIDLALTLAGGGTVDVPQPNGSVHQLPALAVARADDRFATCTTDPSGAVEFQAVIPDGTRWGTRITNRRDLRSPPAPSPASPGAASRHQAVVPIIPPAARPARALHRYHILWEAVWEPMPPVDPALLKHLRGHLYAVVAVWDLTPLEQAVLGHRFRELP